jgi:hypothetical protein
MHKKEKIMETHLGSPTAHPPWYNTGKIEVIEFIEDKNMGFHLGNAIKYISRAGKKDPSKHKEDLEKAKWYLEREIEIKFAYDVRRPNDMNAETPLRGSEPRCSSLKEIIDGVSSKERNEVLVVLKGIIHNLFVSAPFDQWENIGDQIGNAIENNGRMPEFKKWESYQEDRKELKELCVSYNVSSEGLDNDGIRAALRPKIRQAFDVGGEIGLLEKEIIEEDVLTKKVKRPSDDFIREQFAGEALS